MATQVPLRKQPVQQRSAKRVEQMLKACAALIDELGYDGVTTTLIAERAGVAVGSLYQFFPDKRAVVQALTKRTSTTSPRRSRNASTGSNLEHWWHGVDTIIDIYVEMYRTIPGFSRVRFGDVIDIRFIEDDRDNNTVITEQIAQVVAKKHDLPVESLYKQITVAVRHRRRHPRARLPAQALPEKRHDQGGEAGGQGLPRRPDSRRD